MRATRRKAPCQRPCEEVSCESVQSPPLFSHTSRYSTEDGWSIGRALRCASWKTVVALGMLTARSYPVGWDRKAAMEDILIFFMSWCVRILQPLLCFDRKPHDGR